MKRYLLLGLLIFAYSTLQGCASHRIPSLHTDFSQENWMGAIEKNPDKWTQGADHWFLTGESNSTELASREAPYSAAISTMIVRVPDFTKIKVNGSFQVQIYGTYGHNSVYIYGPNSGVREALVEVHGNTLCINQVENSSASVRNVIIRIGINHLDGLIKGGDGTLEGIQLLSPHLNITNTGSGNIYLTGRFNLRRVTNAGCGTINIFGAFTPSLDITTLNSGGVNICGNVGVKKITHHGTGMINIIGANSNELNIQTDGSGKIGIDGLVNLGEVQARDNTCVYICKVRSGSLHAYAFDHARIGVAGSAHELYVDTYQSASFAGRYLCAQNAFVRTQDSSQANINAGNKVFASATGESRIYFYGPATLLSKFVKGSGSIMPMGERNWCNYNAEYRPYSYTYTHKGKETVVYYPQYRWKHKRSVSSPRMAGEG